MSVETLVRPEHDRTIGNENLKLITGLGKTAFEILAVSAEDATERPESVEDLRLVNSVTRLGDGQTVPDER